MTKINASQSAQVLKKINEIYRKAISDIENVKNKGRQAVAQSRKKEDEQRISEILRNIK